MESKKAPNSHFLFDHVSHGIAAPLPHDKCLCFAAASLCYIHAEHLQVQRRSSLRRRNSPLPPYHSRLDYEFFSTKPKPTHCRCSRVSNSLSNCVLALRGTYHSISSLRLTFPWRAVRTSHALRKSLFSCTFFA